MPFVNVLLAAGAKVDATTTMTASFSNDRGSKTKMWEGSAPLHLAAAAGHPMVIRALLDAGSRALDQLTVRANHPTKDEGIFAPLHLAVESGNQPAVKMLLSAGASVSNAGSCKYTSNLPLLVVTWSFILTACCAGRQRHGV